MKRKQSILLLSVITVLSSACVSRTTTSEKGYRADIETTKLVWVWQEEFRNTK